MASGDDLDKLFRNAGSVDELVIDDEFHQHLADRATYEKHLITSTEVVEVHQGKPAYFANTGTNRRAPLVMVGRTLAGRILCVPLEPSDRRGTWRPVTAFQANPHHVVRYNLSLKEHD